jgi:hypothetical protein
LRSGYSVKAFVYLFISRSLPRKKNCAGQVIEGQLKKTEEKVKNNNVEEYGKRKKWKRRSIIRVKRNNIEGGGD